MGYIKTFSQFKRSLNEGRVQAAKRVTPRTKEELIKIIKEANESHPNGGVIDLNFIDTSIITDMSKVFTRWNFRPANNYDISQWDVSNVTNMDGMFWGSDFNGDISQWDVSSVENMRNMFREAKFTGDISQWDVSKVRDMRYMFCKSEFHGDISQWNVSHMAKMEDMFEDSKFTGDIPKWANRPSDNDTQTIKRNGPILLGSVSPKAIKLNQQLYNTFIGWSSYWGDVKGTNIYLDPILDPEDFEDLNNAIAEADDIANDDYDEIIHSKLYAQFMDEFNRSFKSAGEVGDQWDAYQTAFWEEMENCLA